jgi:hypothetical protein
MVKDLRQVIQGNALIITVLGAALSLVGAFAFIPLLWLDANAIEAQLVEWVLNRFALYAISIGLAGFISGGLSVLFVAVGGRFYDRVAS